MPCLANACKGLLSYLLKLGCHHSTLWNLTYPSRLKMKMDHCTCPDRNKVE